MLSTFGDPIVSIRKRKAPTKSIFRQNEIMLASTSGASLPFENLPRKVNESLYEVHKPHGPTKLQILFFHGLQFDSCESHYSNTWESKDRSCIWPEKWLVEDFPGAQIFFVSYDACVKQRHPHSLDMYQITENLMSDLMEVEDIGQIPNCSVVLVGHCFGGVVIKDLCLKVQSELATVARKTEKVELQNCLDNIKGMFFYSTPQHGIPILDEASLVKDDPLLAYFQTLSNQRERLNNEFSQLRQKFGWRIQGLGATKPTKLNLKGVARNAIIVPEAFGREGDEFNVMGVDHFAVCKPEDKTSRSFYALRSLLNHVERDNEEVSHQVHRLPEYCPGLKKRASKVQKKLETAEIVGIVGVGGIGKSTIAMQVFNNISRDFPYTCFAKNVKGTQNMAENDGLWLRNHFHEYGKQMKQNETQWSHVMGKKALVVMDDVDRVEQLKVLPNLVHFGDGSRFIITSRKNLILEFFTDNKFEYYDVEYLEGDEAEKLFQHYAGIEGVDEELVKTMVKKCGGLPLSLEVMGCRVQHHDRAAEILEQTIERLEKAQVTGGTANDITRSLLQESFDDLSQDEQEMFIEAVTLFSKDPLEEAFAAWSSTYESSETSWATLVRRSLVKIVYTNTNPDNLLDYFPRPIAFLWVNELLCDMVKAQGSRLESTEATRTEEVDGGLDFPNATGVKSMKYLRLYGDGRFITTNCQKYLKKYGLNKLGKAENLRYLELNRVKYGGTSTKFASKLSLLRWTDRFRWGFFSFRRQFPISLKEMKNLSVLDLSNWKVSEQFPHDLKNLSKLRILRLEGFSGLGHLPNACGNWSALKQLELTCVSISTLPSSFGNLSALEELTVYLLPISELPESFGNLSSLVNLSIGNCGKLESPPQSFGRLSSLKRLSLSFLSRLSELPQSFGDLCALVELRIFVCSKFARLPHSFGRLSSLEKLTSCFCNSFEDLGDSFDGLSGLTSWDLCYCARLDKNLILSTLEKVMLAGNTRLRLAEDFGEGTYSSPRARREKNVVREECGFLTSPNTFESLDVLDADRLKALSDWCATSEGTIYFTEHGSNISEDIVNARVITRKFWMKFWMFFETGSLGCFFWTLCQLRRSAIGREHARRRYDPVMAVEIFLSSSLVAVHTAGFVLRCMSRHRWEGFVGTVFEAIMIAVAKQI